MQSLSPIRLLLNADVYAPDHRGVCHVLLGPTEILYVGPERPDVRGPVVEVCDLNGKRLIPGLVDAHVHITGGGGEAGAHTRAPAPGLSSYALAGVTTVVGLLGTDDVTRSTGGLLTQAKALRNEGLSAFIWTGGYHLPPATLTGAIRNDIAYVEEIIGFGELAISDHRSSQPTFEEFLRVASDCYVAGLMTGKAGVLHLHLGDGRRGLEFVRRALDETELPPRTFHPSHVNRKASLFVEALDLAARGVTIDVTAFPEDGVGEDEVLAADAIVRFLDSGLPPERLTVSSDGGGCLPHFDANGELLRMDFASSQALADLLARLLLDGHDLARVLPFFSANPANYLRLHGKGMIRAGLDADFVVLDDDHRATDVMAKGRWLVRGGGAVQKGTFE